MSEAVARRAPGRTSAAGQLSDDIGDVLASIRRMISQDSAPRPVQRLASAEAPASVLRLDAAVAAPEGDGVPDLLARARQFTRRGEDAPSSPLRLGSAEMVGAEAEEYPAMPEAEAPADAAPQVREAGGPQLVAEAEPAAPETAAEVEQPVGATLGLTVQPGSGAEALILSTAPASAPARPGPDAGEPLPTPTPMMEPAMTATPAEDDAGASIFSSMIRDMIRQELHGDPSGRMSRDLRAMVLREVAMAITGQKPAAG